MVMYPRDKLPYLVLGAMLIAAFTVRISLTNYGTVWIDVGSFVAWGRMLAERGFAAFYASGVHIDRLPAQLYFFWLLEKIFTPASPAWQAFAYKLLPNLADGAITLLLFFWSRRSVGAWWGIAAAAAYLWNPFVLGASALWGQWESVHGLLLAFGVLALWHYRVATASFLFLVALLFKPQSIVLYPLLALWMLRMPHETVRRKLMMLGTGIATTLVSAYLLALPFAWNNLTPTSPFQLLWNQTRRAIDLYPYASLNTFNFWGAAAMWAPDATVWFGLSYQWWGAVLLMLSIAGAGYYFWRAPSKESFLCAAAITLLGLFTFSTRVHERYSYLALLALAFLLIAHRRALLTYILLSAIGSLNLLYAYVWITENQRHLFNDALIAILSVAVALITLDYAVKGTRGSAFSPPPEPLPPGE